MSSSPSPQCSFSLYHTLHKETTLAQVSCMQQAYFHRRHTGYQEGVTVTKTCLTVSRYEERRLQAEQRQSQKIHAPSQYHLIELNWEDREGVHDMDEDMEKGNGEGFGSHSILFEEAFNLVLPAEEGADFSYKEGEYGLYRDVISWAREASAKQACYDYHTHKGQTEQYNEGWNMQLNQLDTASRND
ncbi:hypothetical protein M422DRAFT_53305 [Sphaerobolus stellatus SS14]|uniref:Uncharacterized protein n=1 Tax=Sphaerobolus stellatus (strain SS14) TaxID=990650 RepID=A0A0C9V257_SPHS4|nr:hypothetical protein M422DRAFT_53305 [Sphaerobolus stellatus SS14]